MSFLACATTLQRLENNEMYEIRTFIEKRVLTVGSNCQLLERRRGCHPYVIDETMGVAANQHAIAAGQSKLVIATPTSLPKLRAHLKTWFMRDTDCNRRGYGISRDMVRQFTSRPHAEIQPYARTCGHLQEGGLEDR